MTYDTLCDAVKCAGYIAVTLVVLVGGPMTCNYYDNREKAAELKKVEDKKQNFMAAHSAVDPPGKSRVASLNKIKGALASPICFEAEVVKLIEDENGQHVVWADSAIGGMACRLFFKCTPAQADDSDIEPHSTLLLVGKNLEFAAPVKSTDEPTLMLNGDFVSCLKWRKTYQPKEEDDPE